MFLEINNSLLFYEKTGQGPPVMLLHGNGGDHRTFDVLTRQLCTSHTVYAIDSRDHGKSSRDKKLSYDRMMDDILVFIQILKIDKPILYGFSDGGIVGLLLASKHPDVLSKLIISGANLRPDQLKKSFLFVVRVAYFFSNSRKFEMILTQPDIEESSLKNITVPTLVLAGKRDIVKKEFTEIIAENIPNSTLNILNGESHSSYVVHSEKLYSIMKPFLILSVLFLTL